MELNDRDFARLLRVLKNKSVSVTSTKKFSALIASGLSVKIRDDEVILYLSLLLILNFNGTSLADIFSNMILSASGDYGNKARSQNTDSWSSRAPSVLKPNSNRKSPILSGIKLKKRSFKIKLSATVKPCSTSVELEKLIIIVFIKTVSLMRA